MGNHYLRWSAVLCISLAVSPSVWALTTPPGAVSRRGNQQAAFDTQRQQLSAPLAPALGGSRRFNYSEWDFAQGPSPNATGNLVFDTVRSFLQHWPNTRYRNGHNIVPGTIPPGTLLYHGTSQHVVPTVPEWTATDPEHSYLFCRMQWQNRPPKTPSSPSQPPIADADVELDVDQDLETESSDTAKPDSGCWHLTLGTTRTLRVLYFDGSSAAKMRGGPMDTQDLISWGRVVEDKIFAERERIKALCDWAQKWDVDGFVRMEMDFEVMLCDFTAGVEVVSFLELTPVVWQPLPRPQEPSPRAGAASPESAPSSPNPKPTLTQAPTRVIKANTMVLEAGSWHNMYPGETRVALDYTGIISFYDTELFPSLARARAGVPRLKHQLIDIDEGDLKAFQGRLEAVVSAQGNVQTGSGVDWRTLFQVIAERYSVRLERLPYILNLTADAGENVARERTDQVHRVVSGMLQTYILFDVDTPSLHNTTRGENEKVHEWAVPVWAECAVAHTSFLVLPTLAKRMTDAERLLLNAAREVEQEICRVLVSIWAEGRELGFAGDDNDEDWIMVAYREGGEVNYAALAAEWRGRVEGLMQWLDWSVDWLRCRPECGYEEMCLLPTWPYFNRPFPRFSNETVDDNFLEDEPENDWEDPRPYCITVIEPLVGNT